MTAGDPEENERNFLKNLPDRPPRISKIRGALVRAHHKNGHALKQLQHVGKSRYRYCDYKNPARFGITYAAKLPIAGLAEARGLVKNKSLGNVVLQERYSSDYVFSTLSSASPLTILPLTALVPLALGIVDAIRVDEHGYHLTQALASAIWNKWPEIDGISYISRLYPGEICYAIFDRAVSRGGLIVASSIPVLSDPSIQKALRTKQIILEMK